MEEDGTGDFPDNIAGSENVASIIESIISDEESTTATEEIVAIKRNAGSQPVSESSRIGDSIHMENI